MSQIQHLLAVSRHWLPLWGSWREATERARTLTESRHAAIGTKRMLGAATRRWCEAPERASLLRFAPYKYIFSNKSYLKRKRMSKLHKTFESFLAP